LKIPAPANKRWSFNRVRNCSRFKSAIKMIKKTKVNSARIATTSHAEKPRSYNGAIKRPIPPQQAAPSTVNM
ncbi:hypothetical protein, partial [Pallidibacillus pasinlerensis]